MTGRPNPKPYGTPRPRKRPTPRPQAPPERIRAKAIEVMPQEYVRSPDGHSRAVLPPNPPPPPLQPPPSYDELTVKLPYYEETTRDLNETTWKLNRAMREWELASRVPPGPPPPVQPQSNMLDLFRPIPAVVQPEQAAPRPGLALFKRLGKTPVSTQLVRDADASPFGGLLGEPDAFGLLHHRDPSEVVNRRVLAETEEAIRILASGSKRLRKQHKRAQKRGGVVDLGTASLDDAYTFGLTAHYDGPQRAYTIRRADRHATQEEGFTLVQKPDNSILVTQREVDSTEPVSVEGQDAKIQLAGKWVASFMAAKIIDDVQKGIFKP